MDVDALKPGDYVLIADDSGHVDIGVFAKVSARRVTLARQRQPIDGVYFSWRTFVEREDVLAGPITAEQYRRVQHAAEVRAEQEQILRSDVHEHVQQLHATFLAAIPRLLQEEP